MSFIPIPTVENAIPAIGASAKGTRIKISVTDNDINTVIEAGFRRLVVERSSDGGLSFGEITVPSQRPVLEQDKLVYSVFDRMGDPDFLYRTRYVDDTKVPAEVTDPSEAIVGVGLATRNILTVAELKQRYFFGVNITDDAGNPLSDAVFLHYILSAIRWFEHELDIPILPTTFLAEAHDYHRSDYQSFNFIQLDNYPLISVERFLVQYPSGQTVIVFPQEWLRLHKDHGQVHIVPTAGTLSEILVGQGGSFLPAIYNGLDYLPQLFHLDYTAGFEEGRVPRNIVDLIGMFASLGPFNIFGDLIAGAGIATISLSMDGLSQSIGTTSSATNAGYGARIIQYLKQIREQLPLLRRYYKGVRMAVA